MAMQNFRKGWKISHKFEAEKADLLTKNDRKNAQKYWLGGCFPPSASAD